MPRGKTDLRECISIGSARWRGTGRDAERDALDDAQDEATGANDLIAP
jgi:hypothetical protein